MLHHQRAVRTESPLEAAVITSIHTLHAGAEALAAVSVKERQLFDAQPDVQGPDQLISYIMADSCMGCSYEELRGTLNSAVRCLCAPSL